MGTHVVRSVAVIAAAAAVVLISYKGINAWRDRWIHAPERPTISLAASGTSAPVRPDRIEFNVSIEITAKHRDEAERVLQAKSKLALATIRAGLGGDWNDPQLVRQAEIEVDNVRDVVRTNGLHVEEITDSSALTGVGAVTGYRGVQTIEVRSSNIARGLAAYHRIEELGDTSLSLVVPSCTLSDAEPIRHAAEQAAWADARRRAADARTNLGFAVGRALTFTANETGVYPADDGWTCESGYVAKAAIVVTFALDCPQGVPSP